MPIDSDISQSGDFRDVALALEFYLPEVLREVHAGWKREGLDGIYHELAIKRAQREVDVAGLCILISDQTLTPFHVELRCAADSDEIERLDCRLGEISDGVMKRVPYDSRSIRKSDVAGRLESIRWQFHVGFGTR